MIKKIQFDFIFKVLTWCIAWIYIVIIGGTVTGYINYRIQLLNAIITGGIMIAWLTYIAIKKMTIQKNVIERGIWIFGGSQLIATIFSLDYRRSLSMLAIYLTYVYIFIIIYQFRKTGLHVERLEIAFLLVGAVVTAYVVSWAWNQYAVWRDIVNVLPYYPDFKIRAYLLLGDANLLAAYMNLLFPLVFIRLLETKRRSSRAGLGFYVIGIVIVHYFASSRGGMLAFLVEVISIWIIWIFFDSKNQIEVIIDKWKQLAARPIILLLMIIISMAVISVVINKVIHDQGDATHAPVASARTDFWQTAVQAFIDHPITGIGPGIYPSAYIEHKSMPPNRPFLHAHSVPFTIAAESGSIGLLATMYLAALIGIKANNNYKNLDRTGKIRWIGYCGLFFGAITHGMVDNFIHFFAFGIPATVFLAIWMQDGSANDDVKKRMCLLPYILTVLLFAVYNFINLKANGIHELGIDAAIRGDWVEASEKFEKAASIDKDFGLYWLESGFAIANRARLGDHSMLEKACAQIQKGILYEPNYSLNYANLAALKWQVGNYEASIQFMEEAVKLAPNSKLYWSIILDKYQETDQSDKVDRSKLEIERLSIYSEPESLLEQIRDRIREGEILEANELVLSMWKAYNQNPLTYLALAELAIDDGNMEIADSYIQAGLWVQTSNNQDKTQLILTKAEIAQRLGNTEKAIELYEIAFDAIVNTTIYGWGSKGFTPYSWFVFQRRGLPLDMLPQLPRPDLKQIEMERFLPLYNHYIDTGNDSGIEQLHPWIMDAGDGN